MNNHKFNQLHIWYYCSHNTDLQISLKYSFLIYKTYINKINMH